MSKLAAGRFLYAVIVLGLLIVATMLQAQPLPVNPVLQPVRVNPALLPVRLVSPVIRLQPVDVQRQIATLPPSVLDKAQDQFGARWLEVLQKAQFDASKIPFRDRVDLGGLRPLLPVPPRVMFANREPCYYRNAFFNKNTQAAVENDPTGQEINQYGDYYTGLDVSNPGNYFFSATCEGTFASGQLTVPNAQNLDHPPIVFPNRPPTISSFKAQQAGADVVAVSPGATVSLVAVASDPDGDPLQVTWRVASGSITSVSGSTAQWHLPNHGGVQFGYVLVSDGKGGYREAGVTVSTNTAVTVNGASNGAIVPAPKPAVAAVPSDHVRGGDHFLTYFSTKELDVFNGVGADSALGTCRYYQAIGAVGGCGPNGELLGQAETFTQWKARWHFNARGAAGGVKAKYANLRDLNLERDMHGNTTPDGTAFYVCNYPFAGDPNFDNVKTNKNLVACVAMEFSPTPGVNGGAPYTKFLVYGPGGNLLSSVNLDSRGEKYLPGACVVCHGANQDFARFEQNGSVSPAMGAQFLPFDLNNYAFPATGTLSRANQEAALRGLNRLVLNTSPQAPTVELINGWYPTPTSTFNDAFVPAGWAGHEALYNDVVKENCRTCHVAMRPGDNTTAGLSFQSYDQFNNRNYALARRVCGLEEGLPRKRWSMPNSKVTFDLYWGNTTAVIALQKHLRDQGEIPATMNCALPNY